MTPAEWFYEYVGEMPDIRLVPDPLDSEIRLTVLVLGQHLDPDESNTSFAYHFETITAIRSKVQP